MGSKREGEVQRTKGKRRGRDGKGVRKVELPLTVIALASVSALPLPHKLGLNV